MAEKLEDLTLGVLAPRVVEERRGDRVALRRRDAMLAEKDEHRKLLVVNARKLKTRCDFQISTLKSQLAEARLYLEAERASAALHAERLAMAAADAAKPQAKRNPN